MKRSIKGQSTLEYVIILAAVVAAIIAIASALNTRMQTSYNGLADKLPGTTTNVKF